MESGMKILALLGIFSAFIAVECGRIRRADDPMVITGVEDEPYLTKKGNKFEGFIPDLVKLILDKLDMKYEFELAQDGKYGMQQSSGTWNGMIGQVVSRNARIAAGAITITDERKAAVDFTDSFMSVGNVILYQKPEEGKKLPFKNAEEMAAQTEVSYGLVKDGMTQQFFKTSKIDPYKKMWNHMKGKSNLLLGSNLEGVQRVRGSDGKFAMIIENTTASYWVYKEPCDLVEIGPTMNLRHYGLAIRKGDSLTAQVNTVLGELMSAGTVRELENKWWKKDAKCSASSLSRATYVVAASFMALMAAFNIL